MIFGPKQIYHAMKTRSRIERFLLDNSSAGGAERIKSRMARTLSPEKSVFGLVIYSACGGTQYMREVSDICSTFGIMSRFIDDKIDGDNGEEKVSYEEASHILDQTYRFFEDPDFQNPEGIELILAQKVGHFIKDSKIEDHFLDDFYVLKDYWCKDEDDYSMKIIANAYWGKTLADLVLRFPDITDDAVVGGRNAGKYLGLAFGFMDNIADGDNKGVENPLDNHSIKKAAVHYLRMAESELGTTSIPMLVSLVNLPKIDRFLKRLLVLGKANSSG